MKLINSKTRPEKLLWLDLETGGLNLEVQPIIEVAAIVTQAAFEKLASFHRVIYASEEQIGNFEEEALKMHKENGLLSKLSSGLQMGFVEEELMQFCRLHFGDKKVILAGNSVHWDRAFIVRWMPRFSKMLSHRILDVSSWKTLFQIQFNREVKKLAPHLAMTDIELSMAELELYSRFLNEEKIKSGEVDETSN